MSRFTTFPPPVEAIFSAREELFRFLTVPRRKMIPLSELTLRLCPGSSAFSSRRMPSRLSSSVVVLARTVMLKNCLPPLISQIIRLVSPAVLPVTITSVGLIG